MKLLFFEGWLLPPVSDTEQKPSFFPKLGFSPQFCSITSQSPSGAFPKIARVELKPIRKKNSSRQYPPWEAYLVDYYRKSVEATASLMGRLLPRSIHAVTSQGFELKVFLFVVVTSINHYEPTQNLLI